MPPSATRLALLLLASACAAQREARRPEDATPAPVLVALRRDGTRMSVPAYEVVVHADGLVTWHGRHGVRFVGDATRQLTPRELAQVRRAIQALRSEALPTELECGASDDTLRAQLTFEDEGRRWRVVHRFDPTCHRTAGMRAVQALEVQLEAILGTETWVGARGRRFIETNLQPWVDDFGRHRRRPPPPTSRIAY